MENGGKELRIEKIKGEEQGRKIRGEKIPR
jgi:hypothetical protein